MNFSELIKTKRKENEITQEMLADMIGTSKQTIANWENDRSKPQINDTIIDSIANTLKISKSDILESIVGLKSIKEDETPTIIYPFLPNELINIKLSKEEIEVLFSMEYLKYNKNKNIHFEDELEYNDYLNIFNSGRHVLASKHNIEKILCYIDIDTLMNIIRKNNLTTLNIQELSEEDIFTILRPYKDAFNFLLSNTEELCFFKDGQIYDKYIQNAKLVLKNEICRRYDNKLCIGDKYVLNKPYVENIFNDYFISVNLVSEKDASEYNSKLEIYNEELSSWEEKMEGIKRLQYLYDAETYPDIPKPKEPELPEGKLHYKLNYKGILLKKFFEKMEELENNSPKFVEDARFELKPYLNKKVSVFGTLILKDNDAYLFKSIYIDGKIIDHLWIYDIDENLDIGETYELNGIVYIYHKVVDGTLMKNYGIQVNEIKKLN